MIYSICELNRLMNTGTDHPLLTVVDSPELMDCDCCNFNTIIIRLNTTRMDEVLGRGVNDFRTASITFYTPGRKLNLKDCAGIIAFNNDYFGRVASGFPMFHFHENESLHISQRDYLAWGQIALLIKNELKQSIDSTTRLLLRDHLSALMHLAERFYRHQIILRECRAQGVVVKVRSYIEASFCAKGKLPTELSVARHAGLSKEYLSMVMQIMTGKPTKIFMRDWLIAHKPTLESMNLAV